MSQSKIESTEMRQALRALANEADFIELPDFIETALYHPTLGYYRQDRQRVGRSAKADFFTASSLKEVFAEIASEAAAGLLKSSGLDPAATTWVEIGAEPEAALLAEAVTPFKRLRTVSVGETIELSGQLVVFSNELFDAQPFRQIRFEGGAWIEYGARLSDDCLSWAAREALSEEAASHLDALPSVAVEGYTIDLPSGAAKLAASILSQDWTGAFIAFDYGKTWTGLVRDTPQGTARGYFQHKQIPDILEQPGQRDITHHICWDHLEQAFRTSGFNETCLQSQEAFIARQAPQFMQKAFDPKLSALDPIRTKLKELMHPALMGQKFQVLSATRTKVDPQTPGTRN